jgi:transposase
MKKQIRRKFSPAFKAKVALAAVKNQQTLAKLSKKFEVSAVMISRWKWEFPENMSAAFEKSSDGCSIKKEPGTPWFDCPIMPLKSRSAISL